MGKITDYAQVAALLAGNVFLIDGPDGTKTITSQNAANGLLGLVENDAVFSMLDDVAAPELHRMIFRGKSLGTSLTAAQKAQIQAGTFKGLWLGDYWTINSKVYRIVDFDYWLNCGDTAFTSHHLVVMPDKVMYNATMNDTNTTDGGYVGSKMYTTNLANAKSTLTAAFGTALLTHRSYLVNAVSNGKPSGGAWVDSQVELPNEVMMYGTAFFTPANDGSTIPTLYTIDNSQLALMKARPEFIKTRENQWLRDVVSAALFAAVHYHGLPSYHYASSSLGVRPVIAVG